MMTKLRVLVPTDSPSAQPGERYAYEMEALARFDIEIVECHKSEQQFISSAKGAKAVYVRGVNITRPMIEALDECIVIALGSVGIDYVDLKAATVKGILVTNCPDTFIEEVADHTMMLLLATHRRALEQDRFVRSGNWDEGRRQLLKVPRLMGQTLGLVGFGRVGRAVAARARSFGLRTVAYDPFVDETIVTAADVLPVGIDELIEAADFISLHLPATEETMGFFDERSFRMMKSTAIFINTGRGSTVKESALIEALESSWIAGAGLDVFEQEPVDSRSPLLNLPNVILSPHNASASSRFDPARKRRVGNEIALVLSGRWPMACVNPEVLPNSRLRRWR